MGSSAITAIGTGITAAIGWIGDVFEAFGSNGAFATVIPVLGVVCALGIVSWGFNKIVGLVRGIG